MHSTEETLAKKI